MPDLYYFVTFRSILGRERPVADRHDVKMRRSQPVPAGTSPCHMGAALSGEVPAPAPGHAARPPTVPGPLTRRTGPRRPAATASRTPAARDRARPRLANARDVILRALQRNARNLRKPVLPFSGGSLLVRIVRSGQGGTG